MRVRDKGASTFAKRYRIEAVYNQEDDVHHSTLSTGQTRGWNVEGSTGQRRTPAHAASALNATLGAYFCGMLNSDSTGGYLIRGSLPPICGVGRYPALPSGPF